MKKVGNYSIDTKVLERLDQHARDSRLKKSTIVEVALDEYFKRREAIEPV